MKNDADDFLFVVFDTLYRLDFRALTMGGDSSAEKEMTMQVSVGC